ncbi:MAG: nicotinate-nucleotide--dimethylbenzimidazole phosphoribosyltransferase [Candidatus Odyssella sp.]|nr:nicotinate-nucleotide--dimethylbenzimidazole phosphoribosyltransferase [Candidatus Odyssella sp.]
MRDFSERLKRLPGPDEASAAAAAAREARLTKPPGSLGRLESLAAWLSAWQARHPPKLERVRIAVFAGNHGIVARGVSAYPPEVTVQMVANFRAGGAAVNQLARAMGAELVVTPLALETPTADFTGGPALSEGDLRAALAAGEAAAGAGIDLLCVGEMGIGNTTVAAALAAALFGGSGADWVGRGTGVDEAGLARKAAAVDAALAHHGAALADPLEALHRVGGRELAAIAGAVLRAREMRIPVVLDGFVATAAAAVWAKARPGALDHCLAGHCSAEAGHRGLLARLGLVPLLDLGMRLGEASGAAAAIGILRAAVATHAGMATFEEAGVSDKPQ